jgi:hypothetical protein
MTVTTKKRPAKKTASTKSKPDVAQRPVAIDTLPAIGAAYEGGIFAGITTDGAQAYALVLLPGDEELKFKDANEWAAKQGGVLPSRIDQLVLFQNLKAEFQPRWYWSSEQCVGLAAYAWCQGFNYGNQTSTHEDCGLRARAVRRLVI